MKRTLLAGLVVCSGIVITAGLALPAAAFQAQIVFGVAHAERFAEVKRYWEWNQYWRADGLDFPGAPYTPGRAFSALVFFSDKLRTHDIYWGFCSMDLRTCQVYSAWPDKTVYQVRSIRTRKGETATAALVRFQKQRFLGDQDARELYRERGPRLLAGVPENFEGSRSTQPRSQTGEEDELQKLEETLILPTLDLPEAVSKRRKNRLVEAQVLAEPKGECTVAVPYADSRVPFVPVLSICPNERGIQFMRKNDMDWIATAGGWMTDARILRRLSPRIMRHASLTIRPDNRRGR